MVNKSKTFFLSTKFLFTEMLFWVGERLENKEVFVKQEELLVREMARREAEITEKTVFPQRPPPLCVPYFYSAQLIT